MKDRKRVSRTEMVSILKEVENQTNVPFIGVTMRTELDLYKKSQIDGELNPYYQEGIFKTSSRSYRLVLDYEERVRKNRLKEGLNPNDFVVEPPKGKRHVSKCILTDTQTGEKIYLMIEWFPEHSSTTSYDFNGNTIEEVMFEKWMKTKTTSNDKQGLEREVHPITPNIENILEISVNGTTYELV